LSKRPGAGCLHDKALGIGNGRERLSEDNRAPHKNRRRTESTGASYRFWYYITGE
jgi:hypothetical protein